MDKYKIDNAISHITTLQERLCYCENNLQYIKRLQALKYWLHKFDSFLDRNSRQHGEYAAVYESYFHTCCGFSFYDRVCNSILVYEYGMQKKEHYFKCSFWHCSISPCKYSSLTEQSKVLAVEDFLKSILYRFISFL